jgi:DNA-binding CsgD family transcriptional regulator
MKRRKKQKEHQLTLVIDGKRFKDYTGMKWNRLTAIEPDDPVRYKKRTYWLFRCDCGKTTSGEIAKVIQGEKKSCGCLLQEHYKFDNPVQAEEQKISTHQQEAIALLIEQNYSYQKISKMLDLSIATVSKYAKIIKEIPLRD